MLKRAISGAIIFALGAMVGALTQAASELEQEHQARQEFCVPLYDQPGIERVQCDPIDGAR